MLLGEGEENLDSFFGNLGFFCMIGVVVNRCPDYFRPNV